MFKFWQKLFGSSSPEASTDSFLRPDFGPDIFSCEVKENVDIKNKMLNGNSIYAYIVDLRREIKCLMPEK